ncbi:MAG TPA: glutamate-1-semialdehyde 2,1-aminomutase [Candidatus Eisenbacteria bacterium]|nr:glutamate-1-semialdehyde 2,1-aminomutase [Candidatus Eisenbacteria bacterium]
MSASRTQASKSRALWEEARALFPGGVNSPVRAFRAVGGEPVFFERGEGPYLFDADGKRYVDLVGSWGPLILGHAPAPVVAAARAALEKGSSFGAPSAYEVELGKLVQRAFPSMERLRFVSSGTEAAMSALRLARAATKRDLIVKFEGCYHGHADGLLVAAGSGATTLGVPTSPGVPAAVAQQTAVLPFNDLAAVDRLFAERGRDIAAVIVEPIAGNMGVVPPRLGFLDRLRARTEEHAALLVFDEVMTGFRVAWGGAQQLYGMRPDLTILSKILGGGFPVGAYGGRADLMRQIAPEGPVYQAGTLSGNPVAMAAGAAQLSELSRPGVYERLENASARLAEGFAHALAAQGVPHYVARVGSMGTVFFHAGEVPDYATATGSDTAAYARWFRAMLERGVYLPPSQFEAWFVSTAHTELVIDEVIAAAREAAKEAR